MGRKRIYLFLHLAVLATTLFGWFRLNSPFLILLVAFTFWDNGPIQTLKTIFTNRYFWAYLIFALIETAGLLHTHNLKAGEDIDAKDATLVAVAIIFCVAGYLDEKGYGQLMTGYCLLVAASSLYCLTMAGIHYTQHKDATVFFYHPLTSPISQNAVFYSVFVLFGAIYLLYPEGVIRLPWSSAHFNKVLRLLLILFFSGMIVLLSSKLILVILLIVVVASLRKQYKIGMNPKAVMILGLLFVIGAGVVAFTKNPVRSRFSALFTTDLDMIKSEQFNPGIAFNAWQIRVLEWRFAVELLNEHHAWLFGVSPGDSQDLLDQKYIKANMYIGNPADGPHRKIRGFIGYNFHDQYIETLVHDGVIGLAALLAIFWLLAGIVRQRRTGTAFFIVLTLIVFFVPESPLTMQTGIFQFSYFPLLLLYSPRRRDDPAA